MSIFPQTPSRGLASRSCRLCARLALPGTDRCELHLTVDARSIEQPGRAGYRSKEYRQACRIADKRADGRCESCGLPLPRREDGRPICQHHHIDGDPTHNDPGNILVCGECCHRGAKRPD